MDPAARFDSHTRSLSLDSNLAHVLIDNIKNGLEEYSNHDEVQMKSWFDNLVDLLADNGYTHLIPDIYDFMEWLGMSPITSVILNIEVRIHYIHCKLHLFIIKRSVECGEVNNGDCVSLYMSVYNHNVNVAFVAQIYVNFAGRPEC